MVQMLCYVLHANRSDLDPSDPRAWPAARQLSLFTVYVGRYCYSVLHTLSSTCIFPTVACGYFTIKTIYTGYVQFLTEQQALPIRLSAHAVIVSILPLLALAIIPSLPLFQSISNFFTYSSHFHTPFSLLPSLRLAFRLHLSALYRLTLQRTRASSRYPSSFCAATARLRKLLNRHSRLEFAPFRCHSLLAVAS